jgi:putative DNA primase/helicase
MREMIMNNPDLSGNGNSQSLNLDSFRGTDDGNADLLMSISGQDIRFCPTWDKWLIWQDTHWDVDERLDIEKRAANVARHVHLEASRIATHAADLHCQVANSATSDGIDPAISRKLDSARQRQSHLQKLAKSLEATTRRTGMLAAARHRVVVHHDDLNQAHYLLNCANGSIDLRTGKMRPHRREDLMTHSVSAPYRPESLAPLWESFLQTVFAGDTDLIRFIQRAIGYSLTGDVSEQCLFIPHGCGSNGKSVFLNILRKITGTLSLQAAPDLLMSDKSRRHPTEQADLYGRRIVVCQETEEGKRLNEVLVKQLTGGDSVRARRMHEDFWEFAPTWKIWLSTNHKPEIRGTDHAIWRRIRLIPFNVKFHDPGEGLPVKDPQMEAKLTAELPGILAWAVQGCLAWQHEGLQSPIAVKQATNDYQAEMDVLAAWMKDCCVVQRHCQARASNLYASYVQWCEQTGEYAEKQRKFGMRLKERGFENFTSNGACWRGIGLLTKATEGTEETELNSPISESIENPFSSVYGENTSVHSVPSVNNPKDSVGEGTGQSFSENGNKVWAVIKLMRGSETARRLAQKTGIGSQTSVLEAAIELQNAGLVTVSGDMVTRRLPQ